MPDPHTVLRLIHTEGRDYVALMQAQLSLQQQTRALLKKLHPPRASDQSPLATPGTAVADEAEEEEDGQGHGISGTPSATVLPSSDVRSQDEDHQSSEPLSRGVPAWLRLTPKGWAKGTWSPERYLSRDQVAQRLYAMAQDLTTPLRQHRKILEEATALLPVWQDWCQDVRGIDTYGLARLLIECRDLWYYRTPAQLWKRFGVGLWQGERQRRLAGGTGAAVRAMGYNPARRALVWNLQTGLLTQNKACEGHAAQGCDLHPGYYRQVYLDRKVVEQAKLPDGSKMHIHKRASRYMGKRFLVHLWQAWRQTMPRPANVEEVWAFHQQLREQG